MPRTAHVTMNIAEGLFETSRSLHCQWVLVTQWSVKIGLVLALIVNSGGCGGVITDKASCCVILLAALLWMSPLVRALQQGVKNDDVVTGTNWGSAGQRAVDI